MRGLACEQQLTVLCVERDTPVDQLPNALRTFLHEHAHGFWMAEPAARGHRVLVSATPASHRHPAAAAIPPCAKRLHPSSSAPFVTTATRARGAAVSAAYRPAIPLPTTTTS